MYVRKYLVLAISDWNSKQTNQPNKPNKNAILLIDSIDMKERPLSADRMISTCTVKCGLNFITELVTYTFCWLWRNINKVWICSVFDMVLHKNVVIWVVGCSSATSYLLKCMDLISSDWQPFWNFDENTSIFCMEF